MPETPLLRPQEVIRTFERLGWKVARRRGSHIILVKEGHIATLSVPNHRDLASGTLRSLIRKAGLSLDEFLEVLEK